MRRLLPLLAVLLWAGPAAALPPAADRDYKYAVRLYEENLYAEAKEEFERFAERWSEYVAEAAEARFWTAVCLARIGAETEAAEAFAAYLDRHPNGARAAEAVWQRALALYRGGNLEAAEAAFLRILEADTGARRCEAEYHLGRTYAAQGRWREAAPYLDAATAACPDRPWVPDAFYALAFAYDRGGREGEAIEAAGAIRGRFPGTPAAAGAEALLGEIFARRGDFAAARERYGAAFAEASAAGIPAAAEDLYGRAWAALRGGDEVGGRADLAALVDSFADHPRRVDAIVGLAGLAIEAGETEAARAWYARLVDEYAGAEPEVTGRSSLALLSLWNGEAARALEEAEGAIALGRGRLHEARDVRAKALLALGRHAEAVAAANEILTDSPPEPYGWKARLVLAEAYRALGDTEAATTALGQARTWEGRFRYAAILHETGRIDEAIAVWQEIARAAPEEDRAVAEKAEYWIGQAQYYAGRFAEAAVSLSSFAAQRPLSPLRPEALYWLGWARQRAGDVEGAVEAFRAAAAVPGPRAASSALHVAQVYTAAERLADAVAAYRLAADSFPAVADEALLAAAEVEIRAGRLEAALALLGRLAGGETRPARVRADATWRRGEILEASDSLPQAIETFRAFAASFAQDARRGEALYRAARAAIRAGRLDEAEGLLAEAAAETIAAPKALTALGSLLEARGETAAAEVAFRRVCDSWHEHPLAPAACIRAASIAGETEVLEAYAAGGDPKAACLALLALGRLNLAAGRADEAAERLRAALACLPEEEDLACEAYLLLGYAEEARGRPRGALEAYRRILLLYPACRHREAAETGRARLERPGGSGRGRGRR